MFSTAHLATGLIIGKLTGDYVTAITTSLVIDLDHFMPLYKKGVFSNWQKFRQLLLSSNTPQSSSRTYLHNIFILLTISLIAFFINHTVGSVIFISYLFHLVIDALDNQNLYLFYPNKNLVLNGPIKYFSLAELIFTIILFIVYYMI